MSGGLTEIQSHETPFPVVTALAASHRGRLARATSRIVARYPEEAGLRRTPHVLRHAFCTHLADADADADAGTISEPAGHADIRTTTIYAAASQAHLEHAIADRARRRDGVWSAAADWP